MQFMCCLQIRRSKFSWVMWKNSHELSCVGLQWCYLLFHWERVEADTEYEDRSDFSASTIIAPPPSIGELTVNLVSSN